MSQIIYKYAVGHDERFRAQQRKVADLVENRIDRLSEISQRPKSYKGGSLTCIDIYIRATRGMEQGEKMRWLSEYIGDDHSAFMIEWEKMINLEAYKITNDLEMIGLKQGR